MLSTKDCLEEQFTQKQNLSLVLMFQTCMTLPKVVYSLSLFIVLRRRKKKDYVELNI